MVFRSYKMVVFGLLALVFAGLSALCAQSAQAETGLASWYGPGFEGSPTASGEPYDPYGYTAASKTLPLGTELVVSYGGRSVNVVVNDRGPYVAGRDIDLSQGAAQAVGLDQAGVDYIDYSVAGSAPSYDTYDTSTTTAASSPDVSTTAGQSYEQSSASGGAYTVQSGDTLNDVAGQLGVSVDDLAASSGIQNPNVISVGQTLYY